MSGEKTQAVWDYSEHATITQGQLLEKSSKNAIFLKVMWKTPLFKRLFPARAGARIRHRAILRGSRDTTRNLESWSNGKRNRLADAAAKDFARCRAAAESVGVAFLDEPPPGPREIRRHGAIRLQFLAAGRSRAVFLHRSAPPLQLCGGRPYAQHSAFFRARERNRADAADDVRSRLCEAGRGARKFRACQSLRPP
jgi:hypothetical protein